MPEPKIEYFAQGMIQETPDGQQKFLLVTIRILCPHCGEIEMQLPGHHLRAIRDTLVEMIDRFPELCYLRDKLEVHEVPVLSKES